MVYICSKISSISSTETTKIDFNAKPDKVNVSELYESFGQQLGPDVKFDLVCHGRILDPSKTFAFYRLGESSLIYAFKKSEIKLPSNSSVDPSQAGGIDPFELSRFTLSIKNALNQPEFATIIEKLKENREDRENLISVTPGMRDDPLAMAIIQDIDLLNLCFSSDQKSLQKIMNSFPSLITAAGCLAAQFHEEHRGKALFSRAGRRPGYSMDEMDDYEGPEAASNDANASSSGEGGNASVQADSSALRELLSQALMMANQSNNPQNVRNVRPPIADLPNRPALMPSVLPSPQITPQMLQSALQSVNLPFVPPSSNPQSSASPASSSVPPPPPPSRPARDWSRELQQMREMGLTNETLCIQALQATNGNVDAAINLIFANQ